MMWSIALLIATPFLAGMSGLVLRNRQTFDVLHCVHAGVMIISSRVLVDAVSALEPVSPPNFLRVDYIGEDF